MWLTFCWSVLILATVVGVAFSLYGLKRRDQRLLSKGLVVLGALMVMIGLTGFFAANTEGQPVLEAVVTMIVLFAAGLVCIVVGLIGLARKDIFWKPESHVPHPPQEKF